MQNPSTRALDNLFEGAASDGCTPTERRILQDVKSRYENGWDRQTRADFDQRLRLMPQGPRGVRSNGRGPDAEDLSSRMKTVWMAGLDSLEQAAYVVDMTTLGAELGFNLVLQLPAWQPLAGIAQGLSRVTGMPLAELDKVVDVVPTDDYASVWGEDNKILTNGDDRARPVKVLVPPDISDDSLNKAEAFTKNEGYHRYHQGFQGAVDQRNEPDAAVDVARGLDRDVQTTKTYIEGGNLLPGITPDGKAYAMVGRDSVIISAFHLDERGAFWGRQVAQKRAQMQRDGTLTPALVQDTANKLADAEQAVAGWWAAPRIERWESNELMDMRRRAQSDLRTMGPVYDKITAELQDAGLIAIRAPGVFQSYNRQANFMNAVPGTTEGGANYFLTNASSIKPLERAFEGFVKNLGVDEVRFVGSYGGGARSLAASETSLELSGGLDCREVNHAGTRRPTDDLQRAVRGIA